MLLESIAINPSQVPPGGISIRKNLVIRTANDSVMLDLGGVPN
eukprot:CAMPEP_0202876844 /NCGR_PEP_ID=MMETSP1391-20130828/29704_1 /ASSEMBLY_ACC=CAM_ASM_000867 /TAXON_ID=1034604 /ORGANISM="Chlamydomonas leiostraca, Strain SAG 11-49" /LENGTH=42 /DNA_ID= /DNA_START= /DNA_END= /DNA_ORIENTATION=